MKDKVIKVRKDHTCYYCGNHIKNGDLCTYMYGRIPKYADDNETQIGIEYVNQYYCTDYKCVKNDCV